MNYVYPTREIEKLPKEESFVVMVQDNLSYDDGYGSPKCPSISRRDIIDQFYFPDKQKLINWLIGNRGKKFKIFRVTPVTYKENISIDILEG